jgi:hypothetical protein
MLPTAPSIQKFVLLELVTFPSHCQSMFIHVIYYTIEEASSCKEWFTKLHYPHNRRTFICSKVSNPAAETPVPMLQWLVFGAIDLSCFGIYVAFKLWLGFFVSVRMHFTAT